MATHKQWNEYFDKVSAEKLKTLLKAISVLENDKMINEEYGSDLRSLAILMKASKNMRK